MSIKKSIFLAAILLMVVSCAVEVEENSTTANKRVREAWLRVNYPEAITPNSDGLHILEETKGEGITPGDTSYCFIRYSVRYLDGQYYSTNYPELAKQLGSYSDSIYFGPDIYQLGKYQMYDAMENVVKKMKVGGKIKFLMPPEKSVVSYQTTKNNKLVWTHTDPKYSSNVIFDVELVKVVDDIFRYQENLIEQYIKDHGFHIDSQEDGFYFMKKTSLPDEDTIVEGTTVLVDYVGKLIENNHCFETNVVDSAKCYRIYNSARTYEGLEAVFYSDPQEFADQNSLALGFSKAISMLKIDEEAFVFFTSDWGYGADGSGAAIPPYAPLYFSIKVREND